MIDGECPLEDGIMSKNGFAVLADKGKVLTEVGDIAGNSVSTIDLYLFAYGRDYRQALERFLSADREHTKASSVCFGKLVESVLRLQ